MWIVLEISGIEGEWFCHLMYEDANLDVFIDEDIAKEHAVKKHKLSGDGKKYGVFELKATTAKIPGTNEYRIEPIGDES